MRRRMPWVFAIAGVVLLALSIYGVVSEVSRKARVQPPALAPMVVQPVPTPAPVVVLEPPPAPAVKPRPAVKPVELPPRPPSTTVPPLVLSGPSWPKEAPVATEPGVTVRLRLRTPWCAGAYEPARGTNFGPCQ